MASNNKPAPAGHSFVALLGFCMSVVIAIVLLVAALVLGLSELLGSFTWSALIVAGLFILAAAAIYFFTIKGTVEQIREQAETVYDVARLFKQGYDWVKDKLDFLVRLRNELWPVD